MLSFVVWKRNQTERQSGSGRSVTNTRGAKPPLVSTFRKCSELPRPSHIQFSVLSYIKIQPALSILPWIRAASVSCRPRTKVLRKLPHMSSTRRVKEAYPTVIPISRTSHRRTRPPAESQQRNKTLLPVKNRFRPQIIHRTPRASAPLEPAESETVSVSPA